MARLVVLSVLFTICLILSATVGKNVAPRTPKSPKAITNKAPIVNVRGQTGVGQKISNNILPAHVFYDNYQANFSWTDKSLQSALGIRPSTKNDKRNIVKRTPGSAPGDPLVKLPSCLGCIEAADGKVTSINDLSTEWLEKQIILPDSQLQDKCVFYTSVPSATADKTEYDIRQTMGHLNHPGLSWFATNWACQHRLVTIWNLYTGKNDISNPGSDNPKDRNFWEVSVTGSWLNFLVQNQQQFTYFENMSRAMARHCGGVIYVMTIRPELLSKYMFIWKKAEYPTLLARFTSGTGGSPTKLIAVNAVNPTEQWNINWNTLAADKTPLKKGDPGYQDFIKPHLKRDNCLANLDYEVDQDWFG